MSGRVRRQQAPGCCGVPLLLLIGWLLLRYVWTYRPVAAIVGVLAAVGWVVYRLAVAEAVRRHHLAALADPRELAALSPRRFEAACADLFRELGWRADLTRASFDEGADIMLRRGVERGVVQCKHYPYGRVGNAVVRDLLGTMKDFGASRGFLVTSGAFSGPAMEVARRHPDLTLWSGEDLRKLATGIAARRAASASWGELTVWLRNRALPGARGMWAASSQRERIALGIVGLLAVVFFSVWHFAEQRSAVHGTPPPAAATATVASPGPGASSVAAPAPPGPVAAQGGYDPELARTLVAGAVKDRRNGNRWRARQLLELASEKDPVYAKTYYVHGYLNIDEGRYAEAIADFQTVVRLAPQDLMARDARRAITQLQARQAR
jgi:restriction system protein